VVVTEGASAGGADAVLEQWLAGGNPFTDQRRASEQAERRAVDALETRDEEEEEEEDWELQGDAIDEESQSVTRSRRCYMAAVAKEAGLGLAGSHATVTTASVHLLKCLVWPSSPHRGKREGGRERERERERGRIGSGTMDSRLLVDAV
jgi:hypothetical protein